MMKPLRHGLDVDFRNDDARFVIGIRSRRAPVALHAHPDLLRRRSACALFRTEAGSPEVSGPMGSGPFTRQWRRWGMIALLLMLTPAVRAQVTNEVANTQTNYSNRLDYSAFRIIADRNIFNPNRSGRSARGGGERQRQAKSDSFSLVGTMAYEKGWFAFFDGSSSEYRKVIKPDGIIAGYRVVEIAPSHVKLALNGKDTELKVGTQMQRQEEGGWQMVAQAGSYSSSGRSTAAKTDSETSAESSSDGDGNDVLKRLLQKREAEENK